MQLDRILMEVGALYLQKVTLEEEADRLKARIVELEQIQVIFREVSASDRVPISSPRGVDSAP